MLACIIQARMGSERFPGKALAELKGIPIIKRVYNTCKSVVPFTVIAIPQGETDQPLADYLIGECIPYYVGPEDDVLKRYYIGAKTYGASAIVRITGDCPVLDTHKLYHHVDIASKLGVDFATNAHKDRTSIDGDDIEYMSFKCLEWLNGAAIKDVDREHVTKYLYDNNQEFTKTGMKSIAFQDAIDNSHIKTSIDTPEDLKRVEGMMK